MISPARSARTGSTRLVVRMADVLAVDGARYPMAGALACAVRGRLQLSLHAYAAELELPVEVVRAAETGSTPLAALPPAISERIPWLGLDLTALAADPAA